MASFSKGTSFTDGVTGDVTAAKLHALVDAATPVPGFITDRTAETSIATDDLVLISDTSDSGALNKMTVANFTNIVSTGTGTAADPAIRPTGDTNTGIFFPAADTIAFSEGGTESMRIDSSGRVGIGTGSPRGRFEASNAFLSGETGAQCVFPLHVTIGYGGSAYGSIGYNLDYRSATDNTNGVKYLVSDTISQLDFNLGGFIFRNAPSGTGGNTATLTERLRITSGGEVVIGATSPSGRLTAEQTGSVNTVCSLFSRVAGDVGQRGLLVSKYDNNTTTSQVFVQFAVNNVSTNSGQINANGASQAAFGSFSDQRLKENIENLSSQWDRIKALRPVEFDYIESEGGGHQIGFVAQEVREIYPDAVGERSDGMLTISGMGKNEARLIKALQEAMGRIEQLESKVAALEAA